MNGDTMRKGHEECARVVTYPPGRETPNVKCSDEHRKYTTLRTRSHNVDGTQVNWSEGVFECECCGNGGAWDDLPGWALGEVRKDARTWTWTW